ncbi:MAG: alpha/beta hydrolase [bacterium]|nr:alpha/beta hydrolase [bacterium]
MSKQDIAPEYLKKAQEIRDGFGKSDAARDAGLKKPQSIAWENDVSYGAHGKWNLMDIYYPKGTEGLLPAIVSVHGGAWMYGTKEVYQFYGCSLAERGFAVVNFNYRLAPEHPFPAALEDVNAVFSWIKENGKAHHIDAECLFAVGDSAGAQLLSQYAAMLTNASYAEMYVQRYGLSIPDIRLRAVALNCGRYDMTPGEDEESKLMFCAYFGGDPSAFAELTDTKRYLTPQYPPAFVMTAQHDFLREEAEPMTEALHRAGVEAECHIYGSKEDERIGHVFHCNVRLNEAKVCNDDECAFFKKFIKKEFR